MHEASFNQTEKSNQLSKYIWKLQDDGILYTRLGTQMLIHKHTCQDKLEMQLMPVGEVLHHDNGQKNHRELRNRNYLNMYTQEKNPPL